VPGRVVISSAGLGQAATPLCLSWFGNDIAASDIAACAGAAYYILPPCWCMDQSVWSALAAEPVLPVPSAGPGVPDSALDNPNAVLADTTGQTSQDMSNQQIAANQQQAAAAALNLPTYPNSSDEPAPDACESMIGISCPTTILVGIALAVGLFYLGGKR
jgi:hypothetical protein